MGLLLRLIVGTVVTILMLFNTFNVQVLNCDRPPFALLLRILHLFYEFADSNLLATVGQRLRA